MNRLDIVVKLITANPTMTDFVSIHEATLKAWVEQACKFADIIMQVEDVTNTDVYASKYFHPEVKENKHE